MDLLLFTYDNFLGTLVLSLGLLVTAPLDWSVCSSFFRFPDCYLLLPFTMGQIPSKDPRPKLLQALLETHGLKLKWEEAK